ncbi:MAG: cation diffusion facilitator family transporter [Sphingomonadales bacterium]|jgi:cobalt-zinc-cadmium efflux system protein
MTHHNHEHGGHHHGLHSHFGGEHGDSRRVAWAAGLTLLLLGAEIAGALISGSLALLADAAHMVTDVGALGLAWLGFRFARLPADDKRSYGFHRAQVMIAFLNGIALFAVVAWLLWEMVERLAEPPEVMGLPVTIIGFAGLLVNVIAYILLHGADKNNLNIKGAQLHVLGDMLGSIAATAAGVVIWTTGWYLIDPILSGFVALILLVGAWRLVKEAGHILLEGVPPQFDLTAVQSAVVASVEGVEDAHHLHIWALSHDRPMMTLHVKLGEGADAIKVIAGVKRFLRDTYALSHTTVEVELDDCADHSIPLQKSGT